MAFARTTRSSLSSAMRRIGQVHPPAADLGHQPGDERQVAAPQADDDVVDLADLLVGRARARGSAARRTGARLNPSGPPANSTPERATVCACDVLFQVSGVEFLAGRVRSRVTLTNAASAPVSLKP